jgi:prephenate dehydratase
MNKEIKIAIQGGLSSFHDLAARNYFLNNHISILECRTFRQLCIELQKGDVDLALMAIENTLVGSILPNYSLLQEYPFYIIGETFIHIEQHLMALPGQTIYDIASIRSHPMALLQCSDFLEKYPHLGLIETFDTADSAREIKAQNLRGVAAIAAKEAANRYNLQIIATGIENIKQNYTRFLILSKQENNDDNIGNKASVSFHLKHKVGALADALTIFKNYSINLTLIHSVPLPGRPQEYAFHADLEWDDLNKFHLAIKEIKCISNELQILGVYSSGIKPYDNSCSRPA